MKTTTFFTALLTAAATASPTLTTTTKDTAAVATDVPICKFDPVKGEYICPAAVADTIIEATIANGKANDTTFKDTATTAADCGKCDNDLNTCMKHWGCWFYDCLGPCRCDVGKKDPQCTQCWSGQC